MSTNFGSHAQMVTKFGGQILATKFGFVPDCLSAKFLSRNINMYKFTISMILSHWHDTGSWNPSSCETRTYLFHIASIMAADGVVMQGARASAAMILFKPR